MLKVLVFTGGILPLAWSLWQVYLLQTGGSHVLGPDPGKALVLMQGEWAIRFLLLTLAVTPIRRLTGWNGVQKVRRMLGLFTFFYASLHLASYAVFLLELDVTNLYEDILERPYITVGFAAWLLLVPLAMTSTRRMMLWLGKRWALLHRIIYGIGLLAVIHVIWLARSSYAEAFFYGLVLSILLAARLLPRGFRLFPGAIRAAS